MRDRIIRKIERLRNDWVKAKNANSFKECIFLDGAIFYLENFLIDLSTNEFSEREKAKHNYVGICKAALAWRNGWVDIKDETEAKNGCDCEVCKLIRACDKYMTEKPLNI